MESVEETEEVLNNTVIVLSGVSGSGKSRYARELVYRDSADGRIVSADSHFYNEDGEYNFDPALLGEAHNQCLKTFSARVTVRDPLIVVDNTNTTVGEIAPYAALALAFGYELEIVTVLADPCVAAERNQHGTPLTAIWAQHCRLLSRQLLPWWPHRVVDSADFDEFRYP